ncbi:hypothetical protein pb186bvf_019993 [Paramecium bursaria]
MKNQIYISEVMDSSADIVDTKTNFKPTTSIIANVPKVLDHNNFNNHDCIKQSIIHSVRMRNQQFQQFDPNFNQNKIEEIEVNIDGMVQKDYMILEEELQINEDELNIEKSQIIVEQGLLQTAVIQGIQKQGFLLKKSNSFMNPFKKYYCELSDGIFRLCSEKNINKAKIILNLYLFNFKYQCTLNDKKQVVGFGLKADEDSKTFMFKGDDCHEWFNHIKSIIDKQRDKNNSEKKEKKGYFIMAFQDYYKKHLIHNRQFLEKAESGDIILFQSKCFGGKMQRLLTGSNYDHVGLVLKYQSGVVYILEATGQHGVGLFQWDYMMTRCWHELYSMVVYRKLIMKRTQKLLKDLETFTRENIGKGYKLSLSKLINQQSVIMTQNSQEPETKTFFCSQLVAAAYKEIGILQTKQSSTQFWPGSFSNEKDDLKLENAKLSDEYQIGFNM